MTSGSVWVIWTGVMLALPNALQPVGWQGLYMLP
jgi:hypothetical protein